MLAVGHANNELRLLDPRTELALAAIALPSKPTMLVFSPDRMALAVGRYDGGVTLLDRYGHQLDVSATLVKDRVTP
jgi:hypothetical protein